MHGSSKPAHVLTVQSAEKVDEIDPRTIGNRLVVRIFLEQVLHFGLEVPVADEVVERIEDRLSDRYVPVRAEATRERLVGGLSDPRSGRTAEPGEAFLRDLVVPLAAAGDQPPGDCREDEERPGQGQAREDSLHPMDGAETPVFRPGMKRRLLLCPIRS